VEGDNAQVDFRILLARCRTMKVTDVHLSAQWNASLADAQVTYHETLGTLKVLAALHCNAPTIAGFI
jgi:hypothetical protein